jgi:glutathione synthase
LTESDYGIERSITPYLQRSGVWFAGLDVIGGKVIEVNVLNPGGAHFIEETGGRSLGLDIVRSLEKEIAFPLCQREDMQELNP